MDYRFLEFPNESSHALHVTCVEVMGLPMEPAVVSSRLLDVILCESHLIGDEDLPDWCNAVGLLLSNLPEAYWEGLYAALAAALAALPSLPWWNADAPDRRDPFEVFAIKKGEEQNRYGLLRTYS